MNDIEATTAGAISATASKATYGGSVTAVGGYFTSNEFAVAVGILIGVIGLAVQWYYRHREYKLRLKEHEHRMAHEPRPSDTE